MVLRDWAGSLGSISVTNGLEHLICHVFSWRQSFFMPFLPGLLSHLKQRWKVMIQKIKITYIHIPTLKSYFENVRVVSRSFWRR